MIKNSSVCILLVCLLISCSASHDSTLGFSSTDSFILNPDQDLALRAAAQSVLTNRCNSCHGPGGAFTQFFESDLGSVDMEDLIENERYISIGNPDASLLYSAIFSIPMPASVPSDTFLSDEQEQEDIAAWIADLGIPAPDEEDVPNPVAGTFAEVEAQVLTPFCYSCHATQAPIFTDYNSVLSTMVIPFNPNSAFVTSINDPDSADRMPRNQDALNQTLLDLVESWVVDGAQNN